MTCVDCGAALEEAATFCFRCGASQGDRARDRTERIPLPRAAPEATPLVDCPRCGGRNAGSRALCGRCGADLRSGELPPGARRQPASPGRPERPLAADPVDPDDASVAPAPGATSRWMGSGAAPLLTAIVVVAALVGGGFGALAALRSGPFAQAEVPAPAPTFDASAFPADPTELEVASIEASSSHEPLGTVDFGPPQLLDGDLTTAWNSSGSGIGQTLAVGFEEPVWLSSLGVANGYQRDDARFLGHARVTRALVTLTSSQREVPVVFAVTLLDQRGWQTIEFGAPILAEQVTIEIVELASGDTYEDLAISELRFTGWPP